MRAIPSDQSPHGGGSRRPCDVLACAKVTARRRFNLRRKVEAAFEHLRAYGRQEDLTPDDERAVVTAYLLLGCAARLPDLRSHPAPPAESLTPAP